MRSAVSIVSLTALLPALLAMLFLATPAAADPDDDEGGGCPPGGCVNVYEPEPTTEPDPPAHGGGDGCCGGTHAPDPTHAPAPDPTHAPAPEPIVVVPAQPAPAQPRSRPRATAPAAGFVPADAPVAPQGVLDLNATTRGSGEVQRVQVTPAASGSGLPGDMPPWVPIAGGLLVAAGAAAALGSGGAPTGGGSARPPGNPAGWQGSAPGRAGRSAAVARRADHHAPSTGLLRRADPPELPAPPLAR